jgi:hypothetical protein
MKTSNYRLECKKSLSELLTDSECQGTHVAIATPRLVDAAIGEVVNVSDGGQKSKAVRPDATAVRVYNLHIIGVCVVQPTTRGQRPGLK